eukprot:scaffold258825_cov30-Prasinocladus_malaysianus.AAC.1
MTNKGETQNIKQRPRPSEQPYISSCVLAERRCSAIMLAEPLKQLYVSAAEPSDQWHQHLIPAGARRRLRQSVGYIPSPLLVSSCHCEARCEGPPALQAPIEATRRADRRIDRAACHPSSCRSRHMLRRRAPAASAVSGCTFHTYMTVHLGRIISKPACEHAMSTMGCTGRARAAAARDMR